MKLPPGVRLASVGTAGAALILLLLGATWTGQDGEEVARAISLATDGEYEDALEIFSSALETQPEDPKLNYYVGLCHHFLEHRDKALDYLRRSVEEEPEFPEPYYWLARILMSEGELEEGRTVLSLGLEQFPRNQKLQSLSTSPNRN